MIEPSRRERLQKERAIFIHDHVQKLGWGATNRRFRREPVWPCLSGSCGRFLAHVTSCSLKLGLARVSAGRSGCPPRRRMGRWGVRWPSGRVPLEAPPGDWLSLRAVRGLPPRRGPCPLGQGRCGEGAGWDGGSADVPPRPPGTASALGHPARSPFWTGLRPSLESKAPRRSKTPPCLL